MAFLPVMFVLAYGQRKPASNGPRKICRQQSREEPRMKRLLLVLLTAAALFAPAARADDYPKRPITLIAVFGPGSASDTVCRVIADPLGAALGQSVVVEARPGAN